MCRSDLLLLVLACAGQSMRLQSPSSKTDSKLLEQSPSNSRETDAASTASMWPSQVHRQGATKACSLAALLMQLDPALSFNPSSVSAARFAEMQRHPCLAAVRPRHPPVAARPEEPLAQWTPLLVPLRAFKKLKDKTTGAIGDVTEKTTQAIDGTAQSATQTIDNVVGYSKELQENKELFRLALEAQEEADAKEAEVQDMKINNKKMAYWESEAAQRIQEADQALEEARARLAQAEAGTVQVRESVETEREGVKLQIAQEIKEAEAEAVMLAETAAQKLQEAQQDEERLTTIRQETLNATKAKAGQVLDTTATGLKNVAYFTTGVAILLKELAGGEEVLEEPAAEITEKAPAAKIEEQQPAETMEVLLERANQQAVDLGFDTSPEEPSKEEPSQEEPSEEEPSEQEPAAETMEAEEQPAAETMETEEQPAASEAMETKDGATETVEELSEEEPAGQTLEEQPAASEKIEEPLAAESTEKEGAAMEEGAASETMEEKDAAVETEEEQSAPETTAFGDAKAFWAKVAADSKSKRG
mmetsp:Transcript_46897/g.82664  ORF Transcript_46897/g.82664 Transcript_46897/m.82664 type:complete len:533 (+) Transcript_46897:57-1655(+)